MDNRIRMPKTGGIATRSMPFVEANTGTFRGSFGTTVWAHELASLRALLQALLDGLGQHLKASFALVEHGVAFEFELFRRGVTQTRITLRTEAADFEKLECQMDLDPSQVSACVSQIGAILVRYPPAVTTQYTPERDITPG